jgi:hypothetical protein
MKNYATNLTIISNKTFESNDVVGQNYHDISSALQTTLEFDKMIATFCSKIEGMVHHSAYAYNNAEFWVDIKKGVFARHKCSYALKFEDQQLGEISFMRNYEFENSELELLESLLCCLLYPLKNATLYHQALKKPNADPLEPLLEANNRESEVFGKAFSNGVNAHIEYNRRVTDKKNVSTNSKSAADSHCPWAVGFWR